MNVIPLLEQLSDGDFRSGQALGKELGISRAAIWKHIEQLRDLGVSIQAVTGKGYRIPGGLVLLSRARVIAALDAEIRDKIAAAFDLHFSVGSTNTEALAKAANGSDLYLVMTEHQSSGRGRRGRSWISPFGRNLYMSLLWSFQGGVSTLEGLSLVCALAVRRALARDAYHGIEVKWPNDVLFQRRKLAGILLEVSGDISGPCKVVIGIGLNTEMPAQAGSRIDQPYSDLRAMGARPIDRNRLAAAVISELVAAISVFESHGFAPFKAEWVEADSYLGEPVEVHSGQTVLKGVYTGVDETGRLLLQAAEGARLVAGGEVMPSLRLTKGRD
jgi:BirA family transcriptional regulator, biotin operon repressor / biotin---[acetyl-CoA-carboxylase] ligase